MNTAPGVVEKASDPEVGQQLEAADPPVEEVVDSWYRFKIVALVARAVQRWQASINPTVDFRKRSCSSEPERGFSSRVLSEPAPGCSDSGARVWKGTSGPPGQEVRKGPSYRGHMTSYLWKPLPEPKGMGGSGRSTASG